MINKTKAAKQAAETIAFEVFHNGQLFQTVHFSSLRKCNNWREKALETPFLYVVCTPDCNRDNCIEMSKRNFEAKHRVYPELFQRPEWDVVTAEELAMRAEQQIIMDARDRTGVQLSIQVGGGKYDVTVVHFDKPLRDRVEIIKGDLTREQAYDFVSKYTAMGA